MNLIEASLFILFIAILSVPLAKRFHFPLEIFLFTGSFIIAYFTGFNQLQLDPTIVFEFFLPPILFSAAYFTSWREFKFNLRPIFQLALGLVLFTTIMVAIVAKWLIPALSWPEAFLLGAIISPTDASAATAIIRKFNVPRRFMVIIGGESLINDATALILYRFSLAAILYGYFSLSEAVTQFFIVSIGGIFVGLGCAIFAAWIFKKIQHTHAETTLTFITAFASYIVAEHLGCSGVISTVVAGIYFGRHLPEIVTSQTRLNAEAGWETFIFIINGFIFTLIGLQLPTVLKNLQFYSATSLFYYGITLSLVVITARLVWFYPSAYIPRALFPAIAKKDPMPTMKYLIGLGWIGMRGIISLAAALAIPRQIIPSGFSEHIDLIIFLVYFMVITTLIIPTLTLPYIIHILGISNTAEASDRIKQEAMARIRSLDEVVRKLNELIKQENISPEVYQEFINQVKRKHQVIQTQIDPLPYSGLQDDYMAYKKLIKTAIIAERDTLITLRKSGEVEDEIFWTLMNELDIEAVRSKTLRA